MFDQFFLYPNSCEFIFKAIKIELDNILFLPPSTFIHFILNKSWINSFKMVNQTQTLIIHKKIKKIPEDLIVLAENVCVNFSPED